VLSAAGQRPGTDPQEDSRKYEGLWHITARELWDKDYLNMEVQAFIRITRDGGGAFQFGRVCGQSDGEVVETAAGERFAFTWEGNDEGDPASGSGWLEMTAKNELEGKLTIPHGASSALAVRRAK
jgi:uncharacterized protein YndB with AHSA1/START domain